MILILKCMNIVTIHERGWSYEILGNAISNNYTMHGNAITIFFFFLNENFHVRPILNANDH